MRDFPTLIVIRSEEEQITVSHVYNLRKYVQNEVGVSYSFWLPEMYLSHETG